MENEQGPGKNNDKDMYENANETNKQCYSRRSTYSRLDPFENTSKIADNFSVITGLESTHIEKKQRHNVAPGGYPTNFYDNVSVTSHNGNFNMHNPYQTSVSNSNWQSEYQNWVNDYQRWLQRRNEYLAKKSRNKKFNLRSASVGQHAKSKMNRAPVFQSQRALSCFVYDCEAGNSERNFLEAIFLCNNVLHPERDNYIYRLKVTNYNLNFARQHLSTFPFFRILMSNKKSVIDSSDKKLILQFIHNRVTCFNEIYRNFSNIDAYEENQVCLLWQVTYNLVEFDGKINYSYLARYFVQSSCTESANFSLIKKIINLSDENLITVNKLAEFFASQKMFDVAFAVVCSAEKSCTEVGNYILNSYFKFVADDSIICTMLCLLHNRHPIAFLNSPDSVFFEFYIDHLVVLLLFYHLNPEYTKKNFVLFGQRFKSQNLVLMAQFFYLLANLGLAEIKKNLKSFELFGKVDLKEGEFFENRYLDSTLLTMIIQKYLTKDYEIFVYQYRLAAFLVDINQYFYAFYLIKDLALILLSGKKHVEKRIVNSIYRLAGFLSFKTETYGEASGSFPFKELKRYMMDGDCGFEAGQLDKYNDSYIFTKVDVLELSTLVSTPANDTPKTEAASFELQNMTIQPIQKQAEIDIIDDNPVVFVSQEANQKVCNLPPISIEPDVEPEAEPEAAPTHTQIQTQIEDKSNPEGESKKNRFNLINKFLPKLINSNEKLTKVSLPDDDQPGMYFDEKLNKWIDKNKAGNEQDEAPKLPPIIPVQQKETRSAETLNKLGLSSRTRDRYVVPGRKL